MQYQNKALRDRLRSTAAENERLHEMLKEYRSSRVEEGSAIASVLQGEGSPNVEPQSEREIQSLRDTIASLENAMKKRDTVYKDEIALLSNEYEEKIRKVRDSACAKEDLDRVGEELQKARAKLGRVTEERDALQSRLDDKEEAKHLSEKHTEGEIARLEKQIQEKDDMITQSKSRCDTLESELQESNRSSIAEIDSMREQMNMQSETIEKLMQKLSDAEKAQAEKPEGEMIPVIQTCEKCTSMDDLVLEKDRLEEELSKSLRRAMSVEAERDTLQTELESCRCTLGEKISSLEESLCVSTSEIESLETNLKMSLIENETLRDQKIQLENANTRVKDLEDALTKERLEYENYSKTTEKKFQNLEQIISSGSKAIEEVQRLKILLSEAENKLAEIEKTPSNEDVQINPQSEIAPSYDTVMGESIMDLQTKVKELEAALEESDRTHELRDKASDILKQEMEDLKRASKRSDVDVDYLKAVLVKSFACGELDSKSHIFEVISRLLHFSPKEVEEAKKSRQDETTNIFEILPSFDAIKNLLPSTSTN